MTENQTKLLTLLQKVDNRLADEFEKLVLANELGIITNAMLSSKTVEISSQAASILNPVTVEHEPITPITETKLLALINSRVSLVGVFPNMMVLIDGSEIAKFDFSQISEEMFVQFLHNKKI